MTTYTKPTGRPAWPLTLIAGAPKVGKSYACAEASSHPAITRTVWVNIGEQRPDELGALGDFDLAEHDGTVKGIYTTLKDVVADLNAESGTTLLVVDSFSRLWDLIKADLQDEANRRARVKAEKYHREPPAEDMTIGMDLWNLGRSRWENVLDVIRTHRGPGIVTARMNLTTIVNEKGEPTPRKDWTIEGHKSLPFDVDAVVKMPQRGTVHLTGVRSLTVDIPVGDDVTIDGWTVALMWERMGLLADPPVKAHQRPQEPASAPVEAVQVSAPTEAENAPQEPAHDAAADALDRARQNAPQEQDGVDEQEERSTAVRALVTMSLNASTDGALKDIYDEAYFRGLLNEIASHHVPDDAAATLGVDTSIAAPLSAVILRIRTYVIQTGQAVQG